MTSKNEEKLKIIIKEYLEEKQKTISENIFTIFLWGFAFGVVASYTNLLSLIVGFSIGYIIAKKEIPLIDYLIIRSSLLLDYKKLINIKKET